MRFDAMSTPDAEQPARAAMTARLPVPQATSSTLLSGDRFWRVMNSSAADVMYLATWPKSPDSQVAFWRALMVWISSVDGFEAVVMMCIGFKIGFGSVQGLPTEG